MGEIPPGEFLLPLFPLPNLVFFPQTRIPLHIFEPRYRQMIGDALASQERIGIILLRPGWEVNYFGSPPVHGYGTVGAIEQAVALEDGRYNVLLRGEVRFRVIEPVAEVPYRIARVIADPETSASPVRAYEQRQWLADLSRRYLDLLPGQTDVPELDTASVGALTSALIMSLNLPVEEKQKLLEMGDVADRAEKVGSELQQRIESMQFLKPYRRGGGDPAEN